MTVQPEDLPRELHEAMVVDKTAALEEDMLERLAQACMDSPRVWAQCKEVLKQHRYVREVAPRVQALARELSGIPSIGGPPAAERSVAELWRGAPVGDDVYVPSSYAISNGRPAIERLERRTLGDQQYDRRIPVSQTPVLVTRRIGHIQSKSLLLEIRFRTTSGWHKMIQERDVMLNARKIIDTAKIGLPVGSGNALEMTEWIRHYEDANADRIPIGYASSAMGWQGEEDNPTHHGFLCGLRQIGGNGRAIELEGSEGDMAEARQLRTHGTFDGWRAAVERMIKYPAVRLGLCAALAGPIIAVVGAPNSIVEWAGRTSRGKSTILQIAQSCWRNAKYDLTTWDTTSINVEAAAKFNCDLPLILDDTKTAGDQSRGGIAKIIYQLISGRARGRANRDGTQRLRPTWRVIAMITGEEPVGDMVKHEGASARVLSFWGSPFGDTSDETKNLIKSTIGSLSLNYGHAGPAVVDWLCSNRDKWPDIKKMYEYESNRVLQEISTPAASRLAEVIGLLECSSWVAAQAGCFPWQDRPLREHTEIKDAIRRALTLASTSSDKAYDAWEYAISEALSKPKSWVPWGEFPDGDRDPPGGWLGYRQIGTDESAGEHAWFPKQLRTVLISGGFTPDAAYRAWKDLGILIKPERGRFTSQTRPSPDRTKMRLIRVCDEYPGHEMDDES